MNSREDEALSIQKETDELIRDIIHLASEKKVSLLALVQACQSVRVSAMQQIVSNTAYLADELEKASPSE